MAEAATAQTSKAASAIAVGQEQDKTASASEAPNLSVAGGTAVSSDGVTSPQASSSLGGPKGVLSKQGASQSAKIGENASSGSNEPLPPPPPIYKRKLRRTPKGILKPAPPPTKAFSFRRDILQQLNSRLAQQGVNVQVPVPQGMGALSSLSGTAQGTAQAAGSLLGGMFKRVSGFAAANLAGEDAGSSPYNGSTSGRRDVTNVAQQNADEQANLNNGQSVHAVSTNNLPPPSSSVRPLRKVRFIVSNMSVIYPISGAIAPGQEDATRRKIEQEHREKLRKRKEEQWTVAELEQLYRDCCRTREEHPLKKMRSVFQEARQQAPPVLRSIDLSFVPLDRQAIEPVADLLSVDFGLQKLTLENCGLTDDGLKSILHALLVSGTLPNLSLASNKRIKYNGWRFVGIYMRRARSLRYLDLSENNINRASLEHILSALAKDEFGKGGSKGQQAGKRDEDDGEEEEALRAKADLLREDVPPFSKSSLTSLRLENCGLKTASLEMLAQSVRFSDLSHLSLRRNRINPVGAVALALMLKDFPDGHIATAEKAAAPIVPGLPTVPYAPRSASRTNTADDDGDRSTTNLSTTSVRQNLSPSVSQVPVIISSPGGGVTKRTLPPASLAELHEASNGSILSEASGPTSPSLPLDRATSQSDTSTRLNEDELEQVSQIRREQNQTEEQAVALFHAQRAKKLLASMPRIGSLLTLDLKSNDIRGGVVYLAQALKKNRTLKVLNLSDNNIEIMGLVAIADALKYNSTLETLDLSHNPCCGPALDGITTLRNAFTLNSNLKRLFLSDTDLSSEGAIALAEFLPEARSLIHLDLTENLQIDIAGVMAMAVSVKMNKSLRCLDLNIPPNAPDFARLSQDILNSCIRNTEAAQRRAQQKGVKATIAAPVYKSALARAAKEKEESARLHAANEQLERLSRESRNADANSLPPRASPARITDAAWECVLVLRELLAREKEQDKEWQRDRDANRLPNGEFAPRPISEFAKDLMAQSRQLRAKLKTALGVMDDGSGLERALQVNEDLESITRDLKQLFAGRNQDGSDPGPGHSPRTSDRTRSSPTIETSSKKLAVPSSEDDPGISSPNFSIGSDDEEEDEASKGNHRPAGTKTRQISASAEDTSILGLGIDESLDVDAPQAAREVPADAEDDAKVDPESAIVTERAKGQLSEEGEIFRRARSLSIGNDDGEDDEEDKTNIPEDEGAESALQIATRPVKEALSLDTSSGGGSQKLEPASDSTTLSSPLEGREEASGEELRKELLEAELPRRASFAQEGAPPPEVEALRRSKEEKPSRDEIR